MLLSRRRAHEAPCPSERWWRHQQSENHDRMTSTSSCLPSPLGEKPTRRGSAATDQSVQEAASSMPEGPAIKNKWKVHWDKPPVEWKVCLENTEGHILFDWIKLIKQLAEKRRVVTREGKKKKMPDDRIYTRADHLWCCYGSVPLGSDWVFAFCKEILAFSAWYI